MPSAEENAQILRDYLNAWIEGDVEKGFSFYTDDLVAEIHGQSEVAREYRGRDDFRKGFVERVLEITGGKWFITHVEDVLASDNRVMGLVGERFEREGRQALETTVIAIYKINDDGKIYDMRVWDDDPYAADEFFA
jgi:ketosteroid isomerase-like protein